MCAEYKEHELIEFVILAAACRYVDPLGEVIPESIIPEMVKDLSSKFKTDPKATKGIIEITRRSLAASILLPVIKFDVELLNNIVKQVCSDIPEGSKAYILADIDFLIKSVQEKLKE